MKTFLQKTMGIGLLLLMMSLSAYSQKMGHSYPTRTLESNPQQALKQMAQEMEGTFQIQIHQQGASVLVTRELLEKVRQSRQANQAVLVEWDALSSLYIPSSSEIESSSFQKLTPSIYLIKSSTNE